MKVSGLLLNGGTVDRANLPVEPNDHLVCLDALEAVSELVALLESKRLPVSLKQTRELIDQSIDKSEMVPPEFVRTVIRELANSLSDLVSQTRSRGEFDLSSTRSFLEPTSPR